MNRVFLVSVLFTGCSAHYNAPAPAGSAEGIVLARRGVGAPHYRIPALAVTTTGTLLAAYDARPTLRDLPGHIAIHLRRSTDSGRTWGPTIVVRQDPAPHGYGDPSLLVDRETGRIFLFHAASVRQGFFTSRRGNDPTDPDVLHADLSWSDDDGLTWQHRRLTAALKHPRWDAIFAASGEGIQVRRGPYAGRLIQQYVVRTDDSIWAASAWSDDHGETWQMGALVGPGADENKVVELTDGRLMLNSRARPHRRIAWSHDGGASWTGWRVDSALIDPGNNAGLLRYDAETPPGSRVRDWLVFSNTEHRDDRRNLVVKLSCDEGATWPVRTVIDTGRAAYSTITRLPDGTLGLLYERNDYETITFRRLSAPRSC